MTLWRVQTHAGGVGDEWTTLSQWMDEYAACRNAWATNRETGSAVRIIGTKSSDVVLVLPSREAEARP